MAPRRGNKGQKGGLERKSHADPDNKASKKVDRPCTNRKEATNPRRQQQEGQKAMAHFDWKCLKTAFCRMQFFFYLEIVFDVSSDTFSFCSISEWTKLKMGHRGAPGRARARFPNSGGLEEAQTRQIGCQKGSQRGSSGSTESKRNT